MKECSVGEVTYESKLQNHYELMCKLLRVEIGEGFVKFEIFRPNAPGVLTPGGQYIGYYR